MQPHFPSLAEHRDGGVALDEFGDEPMSVWEELRFGNRSVEDVWKSYRENLRIVLDEVTLLLENVDAEQTVVTADHGNAVGERGIYGHAEGVGLDCLREVPWCVTSATDHGTHEPHVYSRESAAASAAERLADLGYA
jgi:hypothetical protein